MIKKIIVLFIKKDDNFYKIIRNTWISVFSNDITINVSVKIWDSQNLKWFHIFFQYF